MVQLRADRRKNRKRVRHALLVTGALVVCLLLLSAVALWWLLNIYVPQSRQPNDSSSSNTDPVFTQQDIFSALVVLHGEKDSFVEVECDPIAGMIRLIGIPAHTAVETQMQTVPVQSVLDKFGYVRAGEALESALKKEIRYKIDLSAEGITAILNDAGSSLEYTFREQISYINQAGISVSYQQNKRYSLSSHAVRELLDATANDTVRARLAAELFAELICQKMTEASVGENTFRKLIGFTDSNVRISDFVQVQDVLQYLAQKNQQGTVAHASLLSGSQSGDLYHFEEGGKL